MVERNWLEGAGPDRRAELRTDGAAIANLRDSPDARFIGLVEGRLAVEEQDDRLRPRELDRAELEGVDPTSLVFLGMTAARPTFAVDLSDSDRHPTWKDLSSADLRRHGPLMSEEDSSLWAYARALLWWHRRHRYCPICGAETRVEDAGHRRACTAQACGASQHPRTDPAVIVLVHHGDRCLLARSPRFPKNMFSTLAGFVEPGESLEDCVHREVYEEVGVRVDQVAYHASQPWPFPQSLMIGFFARSLGLELTLDPTEIEDAFWVSREVLADESRWKGFFVPPRFAIARRLMQAWLDGNASS